MGRPDGWRIDGDALARCLLMRGLSVKQFVHESERDPGGGISARAYHDAVSKGRMSPEKAFVAARVLGVSPHLFVRDPRYWRTFDARKEDRRKYANAQSVQEFKMRLGDPAMSRRLLDGDNVTLKDAYEACRVMVIDKVTDRDESILQELEFNHFVQPSLVVAVSVPRAGHRCVLAYNRVPQAQRMSAIHTQGWAALWAGSFVYGVKVTADNRVQDWIDSVNEKPEAAPRMHSGDDPVLLHLIEHKLWLHGWELTLNPLGVVTNDQRHKETRRVYTHYVFRGDLHVGSVKDAEYFLEKVVLNDVPNKLLPVGEPDTQKAFVNPATGGPNLMDVLVYRAIEDEGVTVLREGSAQFVRGFPLC